MEHTPDSKVRWRSGEKNSARKHNLTVDMSLAASQLLPGGDVESVQGRRGRSFAVQRRPAPDRAIFLVWDQGPNGEPDFEDHRYWLILAYTVGSSGDKGTEVPKLYEAKPSPDKKQYYIVAATNLSERPAGTDGEDEPGTHDLEKGVAIADLWGEYDFTASVPVLRYYFQSGGSGGGALKNLLGDQYTVVQNVVQNQLGIDWPRLHAT